MKVLNRQKYKIRGDINRKTKGCLMVEVHLNTKTTQTNDISLNDYGSYVVIKINKERELFKVI